LIVFHQLTKENLHVIVDLEVKKLVERVKLKNIQLVLDDSARDFLIEKGYDPAYGARPMRRAVERYLEDPLAEELLKGTVKSGDAATVSAGPDGLVFKPTQDSAPAEPAAAAP
jgi:ATP-dependent Clp protease ATP-binding subunit ClpC